MILDHGFLSDRFISVDQRQRVKRCANDMAYGVVIYAYVVTSWSACVMIGVALCRHMQEAETHVCTPVTEPEYSMGHWSGYLSGKDSSTRKSVTCDTARHLTVEPHMVHIWLIPNAKGLVPMDGLKKSAWGKNTMFILIGVRYLLQEYPPPLPPWQKLPSVRSNAREWLKHSLVCLMQKYLILYYFISEYGSYDCLVPNNQLTIYSSVQGFASSACMHLIPCNSAPSRINSTNQQRMSWTRLEWPYHLVLPVHRYHIP